MFPKSRDSSGSAVWRKGRKEKAGEEEFKQQHQEVGEKKSKNSRAREREINRVMIITRDG